MRELKRIAITAIVLMQTAVIAQTSSVSSNINTEKSGIVIVTGKQIGRAHV